MIHLSGRAHPDFKDLGRTAVDALADRYGIADKEAFYDDVSFVNDAYYANLLTWHSLPSPRDVRRRFDTIASSASKLRTALSEIGEVEMQWLWGDRTMSPPDLERHFQTILLLAEVTEKANHTRASFPERKGGHGTNHAVNIIITNCRRDWEKWTGQPYTFDQYRGQGISAAYEYTLDVCRLISPSITPQNVATAMKKEVKG